MEFEDPQGSLERGRIVWFDNNLIHSTRMIILTSGCFQYSSSTFCRSAVILSLHSLAVSFIQSCVEVVIRGFITTPSTCDPWTRSPVLWWSGLFEMCRRHQIQTKRAFPKTMKLMRWNRYIVSVLFSVEYVWKRIRKVFTRRPRFFWKWAPEHPTVLLLRPSFTF